MTDPIECLASPDLPPPAGHYSHGTAWKDLVFVSGQLPGRPDGGSMADASFADQTRQALSNLLAVMAAAGAGPQDALRVTAYIVGVENWPQFNTIFAEAFGDARPARTVVPVPELHYGYLVEVDAIAVRR